MENLPVLNHLSTLVPSAAVSEIVALHGEIITAARTTLDKAIRIGELLTEQKAKLKHGQWLPWIEANLPFEHDTASRYMSVYARRGEITHNAKFGLTDAYRLLAAPQAAAPVTNDEIPSPKELVDADETTINAVKFLCDSELASIRNILANIPDPTSDNERVSAIRALVAGQKKALKWQNYWAEFTIRNECRLGKCIIQLSDMLSADPWPELRRLYPWLVRQKEKNCPEAIALWDKYPDEMMVLETARAFHVSDTGRTA